MDPEIQADAEQDYLDFLFDSETYDPSDEELDAMEAEHFGDYDYQEDDENT